MNDRLKITLYGPATVSEPHGRFGRDPLSRFKLALFGILVAVIAFGALAVALLVGWVIAAILGTVFILATLAAFLTTALRKR
jgi:hypothetical protein